jgi:hypothetical protein
MSLLVLREDCRYCTTHGGKSIILSETIVAAKHSSGPCRHRVGRPMEDDPESFHQSKSKWQVVFNNVDPRAQSSGDQEADRTTVQEYLRHPHRIN